MSKTVFDVTLLELMPPNLRNDPDIIAASRAIDKEYRELVEAIKVISYILDIDNAPSWLVDHLAVARNCDFYDQSLPLDVRRRLVKNAFIYKMFKGTPYVVKKIVSDTFSNAEVREWFEYEGQPFRFKVLVNDDLGDNAQKVINAINAVKNVRSWLDAIIAIKQTDLTIYYGVAVRTVKFHRILPAKSQSAYRGYTVSIKGVAYNMK